ncbi:MAG: DUF2318 domain-containing protein [Chloroflexi bacterium]|nr:DUF2318 domain-containing protein [Chloroflexota bacterium]
MGEALVITLREGIEAALVVGIILAYLAKTGRLALRRYVYRGLVAAIVASLALAAFFQIRGIDPENEYLEGALLTVGGLFVASMVVWVWRTSRELRRRMETRLETLVAGTPGRGPGLGLFLFTFFMVFREGAETVLFLMAATLGRFDLLTLTGGAFGLGLAVLFAILLVRGTLRINLGRFFAITTIVLLVLAAKLLAGGIHEFAEVGALPMSATVMQVLGYFVRDRSSIIILMALLALPLLLVLWDSGTQAPAPAETATGAERRKLLAARRHNLVWRVALSAVALVVLLAMGSTALARGPYDPQPVEVTPVQGEVHIPLASLEVGKLHKYMYTSSDGVATVRFLVARLEDGSVPTALDACAICGTMGYMQDGDHAVCKRCNAPIYMPTLGFGGGCNPLPLASTVEGGDVIISQAELAKAVAVFK